MDDHRFAADLAARTGRLLLQVRDEMAGAASAELKAAGDRRAQELLAKVLGEQRPGDAVLSEEAADDPVRLESDRVWIIDPLDGTREFGEPPRTDWAVHVALWERGDLVAGAVALPAVGAGVVLSTDPAPPAPRPHDGPPRVVISRSRPPAVAQTVARALGGETVALGSAGAKAMAVVTGDAEVYVHAGGQHEWDSAAPVAVARAAGLHTSRIDGSPLLYNQPVPSLPDLLICRLELADRALAAIAAG